MGKATHKILFICTIVILSLLTLQTSTGCLKLKSLRGVMVSAEKPQFSIQTYLDGSYQNELEHYLKDHFGFREWLIRLYNQYLFSFYHKTNNVSILFGDDNWLFESDFVKDHYESLMYNYTNDREEMAKKFELEAIRLWKVQELLKEHDIHIFVNIIPGKDVIYPEYLPKNTSFFRPEGLHAYDYYSKRFDELGVNYIDNVALFKDIKDKVDYQLFTKTGTHWSNIASTYVFDSIINYMEYIGNKNITNIEIGEKYEDKTRETDDDLEQLLNLVFKIKSKKNLYADVKAIQDTSATKPYFTVIGDSYFWNIIYNVPLNDIFQKVPYWYYNTTIYNDEEHNSTSQLDFEKELMRTDYIMLNYCTVQLYNLGNNFISRALITLCYNKETIDKVTQDVINQIKSDQKWYEGIVEQAQNNHISVEEELYNNAIYIISLEPEKYFEELEGNQLPISRNQNLPSIKKAIASPQFSDKLQSIKNQIYANEQWLKDIKEKAMHNGISIEEQIDIDAKWVLEQQ